MATITVEVTDTQYKSLEYAAVDPQDWVENFVTERARVANEEIIAKLVTHCNANSIALAVGEEAQVTQAFDLGVVKTATQRNADALAETPNAE